MGAGMSATRWGFGHSFDEGAFRLLSAFSGIHEPERRQALVDLAECFERESIPPRRTHPELIQDNTPMHLASPNP
jgi:hypothetical protein